MTKIIAIIGGSGFVGRALCGLLSRRGYTARIVSRRPDTQGDCEWRCYHSGNHESLKAALEGCDVVVNLVGLLNKRMFHANDFWDAHVGLVQRILSACETTHVRRYLHVSALNADPNGVSEYLRTKGEGEVLAQSCEAVETTIFRPSVIFGHCDGLLNRFAKLLKFAPPIFPLACADAKFAPVYVNDVAVRIADSLEHEGGEQIISLCGPEQYTLGEIVEYVGTLIDRNIKVIALPDTLAKIQAGICEWVPGKPFSLDNYRSLQVDSVCTEHQPCPTRLVEVAAECLRQ